MDATSRANTSRHRRKTKPRKGDLREAAILDAAEDVLDREGVESVTVEEIAKRAGISRGAFYFYFGSKEEVLTALVERTMKTLLDDAEWAADDVDANPEETIEGVMTRTQRQWKEHGVVMRAAVDYSPFIPEVGELWRGTVETYIEALAKVLVRAGVPAGRGVTSAHNLATALSWATERNFYIAATKGRSLRAACSTCMQLWRQTLSSR
jgi:AcrR family transcriptional regulator